MKKTLEQRVAQDKEIVKHIEKVGHYTVEDFARDAKIYIKAIKERRMLCIIHKVASSGMSRTISFHSCENYKGNYGYRQYWCLFKALGYSEARSNDYAFSIGGCGMDMIFHTNYTIIHRLHRLGFLNKKQCAVLAQATPTVL